MSLTQRSVYAIVGDLRRAGMITTKTVRRRSHFAVNMGASFLHPTLPELPLRVILGKLGYGWKWQQGFSLTTGIQWFVPITPFEAPYNRIRDFGGGYRQNGSSYGALEIARMISVFLSGSI